MYTPIYRIALVREGRQSLSSRSINSSEDVAAIFRDYLKDADRETFVVAGLSVKSTLIGINTVSIGTLDMTIIHPREVFKPAIMMNSSAIIVAHNHPSGDPTPSTEDRHVTDRLVQAGMILGIDVFDHIIIGANSFVSLKELGVVEYSREAAKLRAKKRAEERLSGKKGSGNDSQTEPTDSLDSAELSQFCGMACDGADISEFFYRRESNGALSIFDVCMARRIAAEQTRRLRFPVRMLESGGHDLAQFFCGIDHHYALTSDLDQPLLFAPWGNEWLLIDGWDRMYKAVCCGVGELPGYLLTENEALATCVFAEPDRND